uniref:Uncharacterized protein n=1 Tax=Oryza barthii TaxID=65489 RepID=A0A0D3G4N9_9ORYZ
MVDETYFTIQAELEAQFKEVWAKIDWSSIETADWDDFNGPNFTNCWRHVTKAFDWIYKTTTKLEVFAWSRSHKANQWG